MIVTSDPVSPIKPFEFPNVTLTCNVEFSPVMDVPVTVNTVWTGPAGFEYNITAQLCVGNTKIYTSTAVVSSFGRNQSGNYTCAAIVSSNSSFLPNGLQSEIKRITTGIEHKKISHSIYYYYYIISELTVIPRYLFSLRSTSVIQWNFCDK